MNTTEKNVVLALRELSMHIDSERGVVRALDRVSFELRAGETFALLGESGCGKSMTALSLMRLLPPAGRIAGGEVQMGGRDLCNLTEAQMRRVRGGDLAMIFQEPGTSLNAVLTVGQQLGEVLAIHRGLKGEAARTEAIALMKQVGIPDPERRLTEYPFQFSGGMKQRVMIAMALAGKPKVLIADEPTTALDVTIQAQVLDLMADLQREQRMAMMLITHDLGVVAKMAHRIGVMYAGHLIEEAPRDRFFAKPAHPYSVKLFEALPEGHRQSGKLATIPGSVPPLTTDFIGCRFAARCEHAWDRCRGEAPRWYELGDGQRVRCHLFDAVEQGRTSGAVASKVQEAKPPTRAGDTLLEVQGLQVHFPIKRGVFQRTVGHVKAVDGVSLTLKAGRTLALVGESGCGKTTAGKAILRLIEPTGGSAALGGADIGSLDPTALRALRSKMQMVFQDPFGSLNPRLRVSEIIDEGMEALGIGGDAVARRERILQIMQQVGLRPEMVDRYPHEFSGGQRQRIAVARALAVSPQLIVCDEPTSALDVSVQAQILNLLQELQSELGLAFLFITHNIGVVEYLAHDVAVMYLGRIVEQGSAEEVLKSPRHPYTQALLAAVPRADIHASAANTSVKPVKGDLPSPSNPPQGCHFHPRCPQARDECKQSYPEARKVSETRVVSCHFAL
ncbi:dipeptide ABC transporter ATP-binding protein [Niveibacterium umoris]|uniref:Peptide/nickel transport system ATP-binding protein n=1 Tax=Niveibacterium umoris TaxID=1193620 RepID=A0A840BKZ4_9RHOO|nr:ABC transporter ATP-binding protein [Niveibacterium umoris]MBB4011187.1 peptide/nickel transport system ATP-binding protein [Niveibacterium umoris]